MDIQQIKVYLKDNPELIEDILETMECHHIKNIKNQRIQSALPYPSDNPSSIQILLNDNLTSYINTKNEFDNYEIRDIFTLVQYIKKCTLSEATETICRVCNITYTRSKKKNNTSEAYSFLKKYIRNIKKEEYIEEDIILDKSFSERFVRADCKLYLEDGVSSETQKKFGISYDVLGNRIVTPIRNDDGKLITFKGRTCVKDYKIRGIPKFVNYYPAFNNNYLFGLYENYYDILQENECIIFEAEKSVLQCDSFGINNCVAISKKKISSQQLNKILKLNIDNIVLALDNDVTIEEIKNICHLFKNLKNIYYIKDSFGLLKEKDSPSDHGKEIFQILLDRKIKYEEGKI